MRVLGLTGLYCAGKNYIGALLEKQGFAVLDVDKLGHRALDEQRYQIAQRFGADLVEEEHINRRKLGERVFGNVTELAALEALVHPRVNELVDAWLQDNKDKDCVINAALLHKTSVFKNLDAIVLVKAPLLVRLLRAKKRDKLPWTGIFRRVKSQNFAKLFNLLHRNAENKESMYIINNFLGDPQKQMARIGSANLREFKR